MFYISEKSEKGSKTMCFFFFSVAEKETILKGEKGGGGEWSYQLGKGKGSYSHLGVKD